jgi:addiction module HigA family antidote
MPMKNPRHPGDFIRTEIIAPARLSVTAAAAALRVSRPVLSSLLNSKADLSGDMALRIEKAFGVKMDTLMHMQASYDIARTRKREKQIHVKRISQPRLTQQPSRFRYLDPQSLMTRSPNRSSMHGGATSPRK